MKTNVFRISITLVLIAVSVSLAFSVSMHLATAGSTVGIEYLGPYPIKLRLIKPGLYGDMKDGSGSFMVGNGGNVSELIVVSFNTQGSTLGKYFTVTFSGNNVVLSPSQRATITPSATYDPSIAIPNGVYDAHGSVCAQEVNPPKSGGVGRACAGVWVSITVSPPFDFSLSNSGGFSVTRGGSGSNKITVTSASGSTQSVGLSCSGLPSGASCSFSPQSGSPSFNTLTIKTSSSTPKGWYTITVTGTGGGKSHTTQFTLTIKY